MPGVAIEEETRERLGLGRDKDRGFALRRPGWTKRWKLGIIIAIGALVALAVLVLAAGLLGFL